MKTLDNRQIVSSLNPRNIINVEIDYFITTDKIILDRAKMIQEQTNLTDIHPGKSGKIEYL